MSSRRRFLGGLGLALAACTVPTGDDDDDDTIGDDDDDDTVGDDDDDTAGDDDDDTSEDCEDPLAGGELLSVVPFFGEDARPLDTPLNVGWDGRLYTDLKVVDFDHQRIDIPTFYIRTMNPDLLGSTENWRISVSGLVDEALELALDDMLGLVRDQGDILLECSGNGRGGGFGLMSSTNWAGIPIADVFDMIDISPSATHVLISGFDEHSVPSTHSTPGAAWVFPIETLREAGAFLATHMGNERLTPDHGFPVRLMVPGWYGCTNIKWVNEIRFVDATEPATSQMLEFASRTHQSGRPELAADYRPAAQEQSAMPSRIEKWRVDGELVYRVVGLMWGGSLVHDSLQVRFGEEDWVDVDVCPPMTTTRKWTVWEHIWRPTALGRHAIVLRVNDPAVAQIRLDLGYYLREVEIDEL